MYVCMHLSSEVRRARESKSSEHHQQITLDIASTPRLYCDCHVEVCLRSIGIVLYIEVPVDKERLVSEWLDVDQRWLVADWSDNGTR